jgi:hypothetical protein
MVPIHHFKVWDTQLGKWDFPPSKRMADDIAKVKSEIIPDTMELVFRSMLDTKGRYFPQKFGVDGT